MKLLRCSLSYRYVESLPRAIRVAVEATELARTFDYEPLVGACHFHHAVALFYQGACGPAEHRQDLFDAAADLLESAKSCIGKYPEGDKIPRWRKIVRRARRESSMNVFGGEEEEWEDEPSPSSKAVARPPWGDKLTEVSDGLGPYKAAVTKGKIVMSPTKMPLDLSSELEMATLEDDEEDEYSDE